MKIVFDNSVHLGQFCITDEQIRVAAKNSQIMVSKKPDTARIGVESFNENTFSDDIIWGLQREPQDVFYKFMDIYHSVKNVDRVALSVEDSKKALEICGALHIDISNALTCTIAMRVGAEEIHSFYPDFKKDTVVSFLKEQSIAVNNPAAETEQAFLEDGLEQYYQDALTTFRKWGIDLAAKFHQ